ncbi:MAG: hypothetical protein ABI672_00280 [Vicinamibacteria bacterium]
MKSMHSTRNAAVGVLIAFSLIPSWARADDRAAFVSVGLQTLSNSPDTEKAIFDNPGGLALGVGVSLDRGERLRFGIEARRISRAGERAFAADRTSPAFRLGHPLQFSMNQVVASAVYRFSKLGPVSPYFGVGGGVAFWKEESTIAGLAEKASGTSALVEARLGFERQGRSLRYGIEGGITLIPNAVGVGGVSAIYEEKDLGGLFVVAKIGFSRK